MINSYKNAKARKVHETAIPRGFKGLDGERAALILDALDAAAGLETLAGQRRFRLHKLAGGRARQWSLSVNGPWRICFKVTEHGFEQVEITDYHKG